MRKKSERATRWHFYRHLPFTPLLLPLIFHKTPSQHIPCFFLPLLPSSSQLSFFFSLLLLVIFAFLSLPRFFACFTRENAIKTLHQSIGNAFKSGLMEVSARRRALPRVLAFFLSRDSVLMNNRNNNAG